MVTKITDYSTTAGSNTDVAGISLAEGWAPSTVNNLLRALIAQMAGASQSEGGWLELQTSITAGTTQTMAGAYALTSPLSHVTTCANPSDGVALPANVVETQITIVNGGANDLKIWPNNGASDTINGGSANAADANLLAAGDSRTYMAINGTNWVSQSVSADLTAIADGSVSAPSLANSGDTNTGIYFPAADTVGVVAGGVEQFRFGSNPIPGGAKNMLLNGGMTVAQRGSQTAVGAADGDKTACDQWLVSKRGSPEGRVTATQTADTDMNLNGHEYTCKLDCTTAESAVAATEALTLSHKIEGLNLQSLKYGTANAAEVTLSFWFSSPKTGIHCASIYLSDTGYHQVKEFTIASANTWEYFALTFSANTSQKINNDTGSGMIVSFALVAGSNFQVSANAWASGEDFATSNQQNLLDSTSNNVSLAGVQLEVGSVATDFAHEDIGTTLQKCLRYYQAIEGSTTLPWTIVCDLATLGYAFWRLPVKMRANPTVTINAGSGDGLTVANVNRFSSYATPYVYNTDSGYAGAVLSGATAGFAGRWTASSGFYFRWSAEL